MSFCLLVGTSCDVSMLLLCLLTLFSRVKDLSPLCVAAVWSAAGEARCIPSYRQNNNNAQGGKSASYNLPSSYDFLWRASAPAVVSKKEVFQPHLPVRLPCYDLAPVTSLTLGRSSRLRTSGTSGFHGLTGGVYKARERIHRGVLTHDY